MWLWMEGVERYVRRRMNERQNMGSTEKSVEEKRTGAWNYCVSMEQSHGV